MKRYGVFVIGLLNGLAVVTAAFFKSLAQTSDSWVMCGGGATSGSGD